MNERIKELYKEAYRQDCLENNPNWKEGVGFERFTKMMEGTSQKFAELIVKECINQIHVADVGDLKGKTYYLDKVAEHIEEHFGVE